jgi:hypothetical protein
LVWFPILRPSLAGTTFTNAATAMSFLGGSIFLVGAYLGVVEALDRLVSSCVILVSCTDMRTGVENRISEQP